MVSGAAVTFPIYSLVLLLPLEPPRWTIRAFGLEFTLLETAAGLALAAVALQLWVAGRHGEVRRAPLLGWALAFLGACLLSSALAEQPRLLPVKFTLRVAAGVAAFALTSVALRGASRIVPLMGCLSLAGSGVALLGLLEALGAPSVEPFVALFRDQDFEVGGSLRVASTFGYPNTAAGFLVVAIPAALLLALREASLRWVRAASSAACLLMFSALLLTYSRGALVGALFTPLPLALWGRWQGKAAATRKACLAVAGFVAVTAVFTFGKEPFRLRTLSEGDRTWYRARFATGGNMLSLEPSELTQIPITVRNLGKMTWERHGEKRVHLSHRWFDLTSRKLIDLVELEGERTPLPKRVSPGETVRLLANVRAPSREGRYLLIWDMVQEHTTWFSDKTGGRDSLIVTVGQPAAPPPKTDREVVNRLIEVSWRPGRLELWSLAVALFAQNPFVGVGPDNFRWRYGAAAGKDHWDTRTFSNSLYLEILATTGILGATAFFGLVGVAALWLYRFTRSRGSSMATAALASSLGGFLVHGLFDYLLEFTSIYLAFWILLGAVSASIASWREEGVPP